MTDHATTDSTIDPVALLSERFERAIGAAFPDLAGKAPAMVTASRQAEHGDFQSNAAMPLAKRVGLKPREVAAKIVEHLDVSGIAEPVTEASIAGPGFINVRLERELLGELLGRLDTPELGIEAPANPGTIVVDLCGVNLAKQMHVGHLRATVIGDAVARVFERLGWNVVRQSHVGDWGLPIAMVVQKLVELEDAGADLDAIGLDDLNRLYRAAQAECKAETRALEAIRKHHTGPKAEVEAELRVESATEALERAKARLVALQSGDERTVGVWRRIYDVTMRACLETCARLHANVTDEHSAGESTYRDELAPIVQDLIDRGIAEESDGALVVRVEGIKEPTLIRKSDGGFLYATTDIAGVKRRVQEMGGDVLVYCVDARQGLHFRQVFGAAKKAGYTRKPDGSEARLEHAAFGAVLGEDNKPLKTRSGENVKLTDLLDEAVQRAGETVAEKNPGLSEDERRGIAEAVGIAAIKYADLSGERAKDYLFSFDRMLAFEGNTGPYLMYAYVRTQSILRKAGEEGVEVRPDAALRIEEAQEKTLALTLLRYPGVVRGVGESLEPHRLCAYLYDLATAYSSFYENCPALRQGVSEEVRASRLRLCDLTGRVLRDGLETLGIPVLERM
jgi:arginyl-tRNA synthetase